MGKPKELKFKGGRNIALKVPPHLYGETVKFYKDILGLKVIDQNLPDTSFQFGDIILWVDRVDQLSKAEVWLEINTNDLAMASKHFEKNHIARRDEIEQLPEDLKGFWISSPSMTIHLVCKSIGT